MLTADHHPISQPVTTNVRKNYSAVRSRQDFGLTEPQLVDAVEGVLAYCRLPGAIATGKHFGEPHHREGDRASARHWAAWRHGGIVARSALAVTMPLQS